MFAVRNASLINNKIAEFYKISNTAKLDNVSEYFDINCTYNLKKIVELLWPQEDCNIIYEELQTYKYEDFLKCYKKLLPIFQYTKDAFKTLNKNGCNLPKIQWLGKNINKYLEIKNISYNNNETKTVEHILLLITLLENALANIYLTQTSGKPAPHLLRDLLNTQEVREVVGIEMVLILKIIMGSPNSINLRNIIWHGFPKCSEIPDYYVDVLLMIIHSLGSILDLKNFKLKERPQIENFVQNMKVFVEDIQFDIQDFESLEKYICETHNDFKTYWLQLLSYYHSKHYIEFIILILPQIELLLRLHYGHANDYDISAKLDEYYITMDTIFESEVQNTETAYKNSNELLNFLTSPFEGCFHLLYDIFISPNGCRLRDKVSHGEVQLEALNNSKLCSLLLHIFFNLLLPKQFKTLKDYESKLHLNCLANEKLHKTQENLQNFKHKYIENFGEISLMSVKFQQSQVLIFERPKRESELMLLIKKISNNINKTLNNYEEAISLRSNLMAQRELHSKRRKTLEKLLTALPDIFKTLVLMWKSMGKIYQLLQLNFMVVLDDHVKCSKTLRFLKHSLTISENFVKYSHCDSNEWINSLNLCLKFKEFHTNLFLYDE